MKRIKPDWLMTTNERIKRAGWFQGTERDWQSLPLSERDDLAFKATGCQVAYATWEAPVDCVHIGCQIRRGELPKIALTNAVLRGERSNWLRGVDRPTLAALYRGVRRRARETGIYDPWKMPGGWQAIVYTGVSQ